MGFKLIVMKKIILLLLLLVVFCSCSKNEDLVSVKMSLTYPTIFENKESLLKSRKAKPTIAVLETDKGVFEFKLTDTPGGANTNTIEITPDTYKILDVRVYDENGVMTHQVYHGAPPQDTMVVNWVNSYDYEIYEDRFLAWQVWIL